MRGPKTLLRVPILFFVTILGSVGLRAQSGTAQARATAPAARQIAYDKQIAPLLKKYCAACHGGETPTTGLRIEFQNEAEARAIATAGNDLWKRVANEVSTNQMPPPFAKIAPTDQERRLLIVWSNANPAAAGPDPGPFMVHRLNNRQYANTLRDLLYLPADYDAAADFPPDERGDGFDNNAGTRPFRRS